MVAKKIIMCLLISVLLPFMSGCERDEIKEGVNDAIDIVADGIDKLQETQTVKNVKEYIQQKNLEMSENVSRNIQDYITEKYNNLKSIDNISFDVDKHYSVTITDKDGNTQELKFDINGNGIEIGTRDE